MTAPKNPPPLGIPSSGLSSTVLAKQPPVRRSANLDLVHNSESADLRSALAKASVQVTNPTASKVDLSEGDIDGTPIRLKVTEVLLCDQQPRIFLNESYEEVRTSIESQGLTTSLEVTRRNPGEPYMLSAGGNTRLTILQDLYKETGDERWLYQFFIYRRFTSDRRLLAKHLAENLARSDMKFWEAAKGVADLVVDLEREHGQLSERRLEELLPKEGIFAKRALISRWMFTAKRLHGLNQALLNLTGQQVLDKYQPRLNAVLRLATKFGLDAQDYWDNIVTPTLQQAGEAFHATAHYNVDHICDAIEVAFAERTQESAASVKRMLHALAVAQGNVTLADLKTPPAAVPSSAQPGPSQGEFHEDLGDSSRQTATQPHSGAMGATSHRVVAAPAPKLRQGDGPGKAPTPPSESNLVSRAQFSDGTGLTMPPVVSSASQVMNLDVSTHEDIWQRLQLEMQILVETVGLQECFIASEAMPLGYYMEYPDAARHGVDPSARLTEAQMWERAQASAVFWTMLKLSGQTDPDCASRLDTNSRFYRSLLDDEFSLAYLCNTCVGDAPFEDVLLLASKPGCTAMTQLLQVVVLMRAVNERFPDRWPETLSDTNIANAA